MDIPIGPLAASIMHEFSPRMIAVGKYTINISNVTYTELTEAPIRDFIPTPEIPNWQAAKEAGLIQPMLIIQKMNNTDLRLRGDDIQEYIAKANI